MASQAVAAENPAGVADRAPCGKTVAEALAQARKAALKDDPAAQSAALNCLIEAVSELDARTAPVMRDRITTVLPVPVYKQPDH